MISLLSATGATWYMTCGFNVFLAEVLVGWPSGGRGGAGNKARPSPWLSLILYHASRVRGSPIQRRFLSGECLAHAGGWGSECFCEEGEECSYRPDRDSLERARSARGCKPTRLPAPFGPRAVCFRSAFSLGWQRLTDHPLGKGSPLVGANSGSNLPCLLYRQGSRGMERAF